MQPSYSIIEPNELYPLFQDIFIISGTPLLYIKSLKTIILGDIHLGHESAMFGKDRNEISSACIELTRLVEYAIDNFEIDRVICNGDIKHQTKSIKIQELEELRYFVEHIINKKVNIVFIRGNHDHLLEFLIPHLDLDYFEIYDSITTQSKTRSVLIHHGHLDLSIENIDMVLISHEHPAYTFYGHNRARIKLPSFVTIETKKQIVVILPAANSISSGISYPLRSTSKFLSPYLREHAILSTMEIFPFDQELGLLELPPVKSWVRY